MRPSTHWVVSIHTPTKGVTANVAKAKADAKFQSTHPRRVWRPIRKVHAHLIKFQSTHPRRVWLSDCFYPPIMISFNPHTHEGCDIANDFYRYAKWVSIHTPTKGVTQKPGISLICMISFNPHTHEGCDFTARLHFQVRCSFNPHTHEGCDPAYPYLSPCLGCFNPHTHEGCDTVWPSKILIFSVFQSTHPRRVWH